MECFADRSIYIGVNDGSFYWAGAYCCDETSGEITRNPEYEGLNALFLLPLDVKKADPAAAEALLEAVRADWEEPDETAPASSADMAVSEWLEQAKDSLDVYARPVESTRQVVTLSEDGRYHFSWDYGGSSVKGAFVPSMAPEGETGERVIIGTSYGEGISDLLIETMTINGDGTYTLLIYEPIVD